MFTSVMTRLTDWLWLRAPARGAFLNSQSARDGAPAAAIVLRVWCRAASAGRPGSTVGTFEAGGSKMSTPTKLHTGDAGGTTLAPACGCGDEGSRWPAVEAPGGAALEGGVEDLGLGFGLESWCNPWAMEAAATAAALTHLGAAKRCARHCASRCRKSLSTHSCEYGERQANISAKCGLMHCNQRFLRWFIWLLLEH